MTIRVSPPNLDTNSYERDFNITPGLDAIKSIVQWQLKQGDISTMDLRLYTFDERARLAEIIDSSNRSSKEGGIVKMRESEFSESSVGLLPTGHVRNTDGFKIHLNKVSDNTSAIFLFLDGVFRSFHTINDITLSAYPILTSYNEFYPSSSQSIGKLEPIFNVPIKTPTNNKRGVYAGVFYKDGWNEEDNCQTWRYKCFNEDSNASSNKDIQDYIRSLIINNIPSLAKFRSRIFKSIRDICNALSSHSLPKLKKKFQKNDSGLPLKEFISVLYKQLYESNNKINSSSESAYVIAMIYEMFFHIDYNNDGSIDWDEFTSFCVQTGLSNSSMMRNHKVNDVNGANNYSLEQYVIEYGEEILQRDHILSAYRYIVQMRYIKEIKKIIVIPEDSDNICILDEKFRLHSYLYPSKVQIIGNNMVKKKNSSASGEDGSMPGNSSGKLSKDLSNNYSAFGNVLRPVIYDAIYLSGRDLYAYTSSDHSITICKEQSSMEGTKINYIQFNRFYHTLLHLKLCWSEKYEILCSTASNRVIFGWNINTGAILFQISRHNDIITDFISVDNHGIFITCSMDKRIVLWSSTSRRVKGVLLKHQRGVRSVHAFDNTLLSAGFECDAYTWDISSRDCVAILKGHRHPIVAAKLMCEKALTEREYRAITVDEIGEFRLWNIYVRERTADPVPVPTIQIFEMQNSESPLNQFRFISLPYNTANSTGYYSNIFACSTKLMHFLPEKNMKEFVPPAACACNEASAMIVTCVGKNILCYDMSEGDFTNVFENITSNEIFSICMDGDRGRRIFVGTSSGEIYLIHTMNGVVIDSIQSHTKEITSICQYTEIIENTANQKSDPPKQSIYSCGMDGHLRMYEENGGKLHIQNQVDNVFGENIGITQMKLVPTLQVLLLSSSAKNWTIINCLTLKKLILVQENDIITAIEIVGASNDDHDLNKKNETDKLDPEAKFSKESLLTVAISTTISILIYTINMSDMRGIKTYELIPNNPVYITNLCVCRAASDIAVNYTPFRRQNSSNMLNLKALTNNLTNQGHYLLASCDDGKILVWESIELRYGSEAKHKIYFKPGSQYLKKYLRNKKNLINGAPTVETTTNEDVCLTRDASYNDINLTLNNFNGMDNSGNVININTSSLSPNTEAIIENAQEGWKKMIQKTWIEGTSQELFPLASINIHTKKGSTPTPKHNGGRNSFQFSTEHLLYPKTTKQAHFDNIPLMVPLPSHSCIISLSHDGYHRIWTHEMECLGELLLPNLTEAMKANSLCTEPGTQWRFILEQIPVTQFHIELSEKLSRELTLTLSEKKKEAAAAAAALKVTSDSSTFLTTLPIKESTSPTKFKLISEPDPLKELDEKSISRLNILRSLNEKSSPFEDAPPTRLPTKEEKEYVKLSLLSLKDNDSFNGSYINSSLDTSSFATDDFFLTNGSSLDNPSIVSNEFPPIYDNSINNNINSLLLSKSTSSLSPLRVKNSKLINSISTYTNSSGLSRQEITEQKKFLVKNFNKIRQTINKDVDQSEIFPGPTVSKLNDNIDPLISTSSTFSNDVCLSCFGIPSNWVIPGERDIFGQSTMNLPHNVPDNSIAPPFSEPSINALQREGLIDAEGKKILRKIGLTSERVEVYDRSQPTLLIRNISMTTSIKLPSIDKVKPTEVNFGPQKEMYKNAEKFLKSKGVVKQSVIRNAVVKSRIEDNVRKINSTIHLIYPRAHDEVILPKTQNDLSSLDPLGDDEYQKLRSEENKMKIRLMKSASLVPPEAQLNKRPLDKNSLDRWISKWNNAFTDTGPLDSNLGRDYFSNQKKKQKKREALSQSMIVQLEKKLRKAIRAEFYLRMNKIAAQNKKTIKLMEEDGTNGNTDINNDLDSDDDYEVKVQIPKAKVTLTTRDLMPHYSIETVNQFMNIFSKVDDNFSGDLDINEWIELFKQLNANISESDARLIFMKIDINADGSLSMRELIPVVFSQATKEQMKQIITYAEAELSKSFESDSKPCVTGTDLEFLFEAYDTENVGFVDVSLIKERIKSMKLSEQAFFFFLDTISDLADDEMVNLVEFKRLFKPFMNTKR